MAITWTLENTPSAGTAGWADVIWVSTLGLYVAAGGGNPNKVMTSPDAINWTARPIANLRGIASLAWNGSVVSPVIVGLSGSLSNQCIFTSPDAINWTLRGATPYGAAHSMRAVACGAGRFVAVGAGAQAMYSVDDGVTWTASAALPDLGTQLSCITYDSFSGLFVALSELSDIRILSSPDGITWTGHHGFEVAYELNWTSIAADGAGNLAATHKSAPKTQQVMTSAGNLDDPWIFETTPQDPDNSVEWKSIRHGSGLIRWVAVGRQVNPPRQTGYLVMTSPGTGTWTAEVSPDDTENIFWNGVCYSSSLAQYVAVGFRELDHTTEALGGIASGGNNVEIDGSGGVVLNRGTADNGWIPVSPTGTIRGAGGLVLNRGTDDNGLRIAASILGSGGLVLNRGTDDNGMTISTTTIGSGGLVLNSGRTGGNGLTVIQCRDDWTNPGALPYVPLNVAADPPPATECTDDWGPSAPGHLPYVPLQ